MSIHGTGGSLATRLRELFKYVFYYVLDYDTRETVFWVICGILKVLFSVSGETVGIDSVKDEGLLSRSAG